jgi:hypothetical protein
MSLDAFKAREPALAALLDLLATLPRFDARKPAKSLQGDVPAVQEAEKLYHGFNKKYQRRKISDDGTPTIERAPLLQELYKLEDWINFRKLLSHSTAGRERKKRSNKRHRDKVKQDDPRAWMIACNAKRGARLERWKETHYPKFLRVLAAVEQSTGTEAARLFYGVLNDLGAKFVDEDRAVLECYKLRMRVLLGRYTADPSLKNRQALERLAHKYQAELKKLAQDLREQDPVPTLEDDIAERYPPIATDWTALEQSDQGPPSSEDVEDPPTSD